MRMSISSKGSLVQKCESGEFDSHTTTNIINMTNVIAIWLTLGILKVLVALIPEVKE